MTYDEAKAKVLALMPCEGALFVEVATDEVMRMAQQSSQKYQINEYTRAMD